jgi:hypothetical protein
MKSITFKKYIWVHSILSFASLYSLIIKYEIKDLYYKDTYRLTNSDRLTFIPIFIFLSFAVTWLYYFLSKNKDNVITNKDYKKIMIYWFLVIISNFIISTSFLPVFYQPFTYFYVDSIIPIINIFINYLFLSYINKNLTKKSLT